LLQIDLTKIRPAGKIGTGIAILSRIDVKPANLRGIA
jgi:hypothetical protein